MSRFWSIDSPVMNGLATVGDMIVLNMVYVICCLPIITIGAATTSLYTVTMGLARREGTPILSTFFKAFKQNFKISTICWLIVLAASALLIFDFQLAGGFEGGVKMVIRVALGAILVLFIVAFTYLFPYIARFENTPKETFKNAFIMSIAHFPYTLMLAGLSGGVFIIAIFTSQTFAMATLVGAFFGFAVLAYVKSFLYVKVFSRYENTDE